MQTSICRHIAITLSDNVLIHITRAQNRSHPRLYTTSSSKGVSPPPLTLTPSKALDSTRASSTLQSADPSTSSPPSRDSFRIFSWNIDGLKTFLPSLAPYSGKFTSAFRGARASRDALKANGSPTADLPSTPTAKELLGSASTLRAFLSRHNWPEVLFLQELKISRRKGPFFLTELLETLNTPLNAADTVFEDRAYTLNAVLPRDRQNCTAFAGYMYGVATIIRKDFARKWVATVREVDWDIEGRVSVVEMRGGPEGQDGDSSSTTKPLALIAIYGLYGGTRPHLCPETGAVHPIYPTRNHRLLAFNALLLDECHSLEARGFNVVVAGDMNMARGDVDAYPRLRTDPPFYCVHRADFNRKFFGEEDNKRAGAWLGPGKQDMEKEKCLDAVDVFRAIYGMEKRYTFYSQSNVWGTSCNRVDMVIVSKQLWEDGRVIDTGILNTPQERGPSDHVPIWVEIGL
ncbi:hypothetical protein SMACR_03068 [Sordaria macrospora]|uniref:WGS project CABT00000000 data, contig 2.7 n=2 Tax=Sordaria macrospora TaxID=5147 RepID=F7VUB5_SORMK|nr:uncharacterized protein SMAC_03068 [Sordaria macrospora k-hell]KAA8632485.1 hypothetical protein SMACR_03068 [Sordaria macrospora]KAH7630987.1 Endonuclease/exonuclease/phosphatase [Sordaria sp. MPI-SDFR-AT-0083]WPJ61905.1 hypothetical protein SMAC4_03068 [Sordaria macrospora]CCC09103.1 unnamed protein product [Sordaria macrospora k-hell]